MTLRAVATVLMCFIALALASPAAAGPNFHLFDQQGQMVSLNEFAGRPVVLFFWASWCERADQSLATFQAADHVGVTLLAIDETVVEEAPEAVKEHVQGLHLTIPVLFDDLGEAAQILDVKTLPGIVALDVRHRVVYRMIGNPSPADVRAAVRAARLTATQSRQP